MDGKPLESQLAHSQSSVVLVLIIPEDLPQTCHPPTRFHISAQVCRNMSQTLSLLAGPCSSSSSALIFYLAPLILFAPQLNGQFLFSSFFYLCFLHLFENSESKALSSPEKVQVYKSLQNWPLLTSTIFPADLFSPALGGFATHHWYFAFQFPHHPDLDFGAMTMQAGGGSCGQVPWHVPMPCRGHLTCWGHEWCQHRYLQALRRDPSPLSSWDGQCGPALKTTRRADCLHWQVVG